MIDETLEDFLKRGGTINKVETPSYSQDCRSDYNHRDKIDIAKKDVRHPADKMFNAFVNRFNGRTKNWKFTK